MVDPGTRPRSWTSLALTLVLGLLASACQIATATFRGASFVPPPRTINDLAAMLSRLADRRLVDTLTAYMRLAEASPCRREDGISLALSKHYRGVRMSLL
jgi:hypothetical protein